jgi:two-component system, NtrC family, sensor kinase
VPDTVDDVTFLRVQVETLSDLLAVHEEQAAKQFDTIRAAEASLRDIYRTLPGALVVTDAEGIIERANETTTSLVECAENDLVGRPLSTIFESKEALTVSHVETAVGRGGVLRTEADLVSRSGSRIPVLLYVALSHSSRRKLVCVGLDIRERRRLEQDLRHAQKLESVGRLAAGVAHEINTPVQFVSDSIHFVRDAVRDLFDVIAKLGDVQRSVLAGAPSMEAVAAASEASESADLEYLVDHVPKALERALDGLDRVAAIVRSMKEFAHPDQREMTEVDLNHAVESTLIIARTEYKYVADVETDLSALPKVRCYGGDLNQAILNILVNAAHAIADVVAGSDRRGIIRVRTYQDGNDAVISIGDTGGGIPAAVRDRIFDPFFTTKDVGKGTGQGLAIAHAVVVDKHQGRLTFETETGVGTTFFIRLPIRGVR